MAHAGNIPSTSVAVVLTTACHTVNHTTRHVASARNVSVMASIRRPCVSSVTNGQT